MEDVAILRSIILFFRRRTIRWNFPCVCCQRRMKSKKLLKSIGTHSINFGTSATSKTILWLQKREQGKDFHLIMGKSSRLRDFSSISALILNPTIHVIAVNRGNEMRLKCKLCKFRFRRKFSHYETSNWDFLFSNVSTARECLCNSKHYTGAWQ